MRSNNRITDRELFPAQAILAVRGADALRKLLPLAEDENPAARWVAASFAYDVAPEICRPVLEGVMSERSMIGMLAWAVLAHKNPDAPPDPELIGLSRPSDSGGEKPEL